MASVTTLRHGAAAVYDVTIAYRKRSQPGIRPAAPSMFGASKVLHRDAPQWLRVVLLTGGEGSEWNT